MDTPAVWIRTWRAKPFLSLTLQAWKPTIQILQAKEFNFGC